MIKINYIHGWEDKSNQTQGEVVMNPILDGGIVIGWSADGIGFGELTITSKNGKLTADTEGMSNVFVGAIFDTLLSNLSIKG